MIDFHGPKKRLDDVDLPRIGAEIGVGEDEVHAIMEVETSGGPSDKQGRLKQLYEPHVAWRCSSGKVRDQLAAAGLAYPRWRSGYPADSYPRLTAAMAIDETVALKACSWGLGQILGENHLMIGYATPQAMVEAFVADEENHVEAMIRFIQAAHIDDDLRAHRWDVVARIYNGPGYASHGYHTRLAAAYAKWSRIKDTPWDGKPGAST